MTAPLHIGQVPQLFFDNYIIEMVQGLTRRMHRPQKCAQNPLIAGDRPWEIAPYFRTGTMNVSFDPLERLYKCWYCDYAWDYDEYMARGEDHAGLVVGGWLDTADCRWLYAESEDGINWHKPELDYRPVDGRRTNICLGREDYGQVYTSSFFLDELETDPARRFKALHWRHRSANTGLDKDQISVAYSADGRSWTTHERTVVVGNNTERIFGDEMMVLPDPIRGQYLLNVRRMVMFNTLDFKDVPCREEKNWGDPYYPDEPHLMNKRRVFSAASNSLWEWPVLRDLLTPDDVEDNLDDQFYSMPIIRTGDLYIGFLNVFHDTDNTMNVQLLYSRDGFHWTRAERGRPFLDLGDPKAGAWDPFLVEISNSVVVRDDAIRIYYGGSAAHHDWWMYGEQEGLEDMPDQAGVCRTALGLATLRPEGFFSLDSTLRPGLLLTRPFTSAGDRLVVNAVCAPGGYLEVELTDADDQVVKGYERTAHDTFTGDSTRHVVTWGGRSHLPFEVLSQGAKLRFWSRYASLFCFRIAGL